MTRHDTLVLLTVTAAAFATPLQARAQQAPSPVVGFMNGSSSAEMVPRAAAFRAGLAELGFSEGQNVVIEFHWGEGHYDRLPGIAQEFVRKRVAVIAATGGVPSVRAARGVTSSIPIVFTMGGDPVESGLVASLNRPGGNVTGVTLLSGPIASKRIALVHELIPNVSAMAVLANVAGPNSEVEAKLAAEAAQAIGWQARILSARGDNDLEDAFAELGREHVDALFIATDPVFEARREQIVALAARYGLPTIYALRDYPVAGGLMSYGASITDTYRQAGLYVGRILKGEQPGELPVRQATKFDLVINLKTARALRLEVPPTLLALADEVIE